MSTFLSPDTSIALLKAAQSDTAEASKKLVRNTVKTQVSDKIEETAVEFEAMFLSEMMKPMFEGLSTDPPFGGGKGEEIFRGFMLQEYGRLISQTGGIGLANQIKDHMIKLQENTSHGEHAHTKTDDVIDADFTVDITESDNPNGAG